MTILQVIRFREESFRSFCTRNGLTAYGGWAITILDELLSRTPAEEFIEEDDLYRRWQLALAEEDTRWGR